MSATLTLESDLCRCCHSQGGLGSLAVPQSYLEEIEIYSDMIKDCFNIEINPVPGQICERTYKICKACIKKLRSASNFRKQVKNCEKKFLEMYYKNRIKVLNSTSMVVVKEESQELVIDETDPNQATTTSQNSALQKRIIAKHKPFKESLQMDDDDADGADDYHFNEDEKDNLNLSEDELCILKKETIDKSTKTDKKFKKPGRPRRTEEVKECKKERPKRMKFRLKPEDYRKDGERVLCGHCDRVYDKICSLRFHIKTKHYKIPQYKCPFCSKEFMTLAPFTIHKLEQHNVDERFNCNACKGTFNTKVQLRKHINNFHMLGEKYKCDICDYESFSFEGMYKHKFKHKTSKDYHCKFCPKSFLRKTTLDLHERIHTGDRRKICKVCNQAFVQKSSLNYHMAKYHPGVNY